MSATHALYRFYATDGTLLYVGITADPGARWRKHARDKPWWHDVAQITVEKHPSRPEVLEAERTAIIAEQPLHNVVHNTGRPLSQLAEEDTILIALAGCTDAGPWGVRAEHMPDDCHNVCVKAGVDSLYYPHFWHQGTGYYTCDQGHHWTCGWVHNATGAAPEHAGVPAYRYNRAAVDQ